MSEPDFVVQTKRLESFLDFNQPTYEGGVNHFATKPPSSRI